MGIRKGTPDEVKQATEILAWLPRPIYDMKGGTSGMSKDGPGAAFLRKHDLIGYAGLLTISRGRESRPTQFAKLADLHALVVAERRARPGTSRETKFKCDGCEDYKLESEYDTSQRMCHSCIKMMDQEESKAVVNGLPDFTEWSEKLEALKAIQLSNSNGILELKQMMIKLMRGLGETP
jgi:hypothetical protein